MAQNGKQTQTNAFSSQWNMNYFEKKKEIQAKTFNDSVKEGCVYN